MWVKIDDGINIVNLEQCKEIYIGADGSTNLYRVHLRLVDGDDRVISSSVSKKEALSIVHIIDQALTYNKPGVLDLDRELNGKKIQEKKYGPPQVGFEGLATF